jgi:glucose-6-phosphate isomerase
MTPTAPSSLRAHAERLARTRTLDLFAADAGRLALLSRDAPHLRYDASKHKLDAAALDALFALAEEADALGFLRRMAAGEIVNPTEKRAALHTALRGTPAPADITAAIAQTQARLDAFAQGVTSGAIAGRGGPFTAIVHLGIGGSDLGPRLVIDALASWRRPGMEVRFAANIDGADIVDALAGLDPARTLVVVVSKTFTTLETLANADAARDWLRAGLGEHDVGDHLVAVSAAPAKAMAWGAREDRVFPFWDFVGGRYSVWSAVGITAQIALVDGAFAAFKAGAAAMDAHALTASPRENAPLLAALVQSYARIAQGAQSYALIPYARRLRLLPAFLQQLEMESNGKRVRADGAALSVSAAQTTWGDVGTNAQHSFFQLLHQGVDAIPVEFIVPEETEGPQSQRAGLIGNALAQAEALLVGRTQQQAHDALIAAGAAPDEARVIAAHKTFPGDRGSTLIGIVRPDPQTLGALIAFYEHRTVLQAALMGINPFDQWGVELGKEMASVIAREIAAPDMATAAHDPSTQHWIRRLARRI